MYLSINFSAKIYLENKVNIYQKVPTKRVY